MEAAVILQPEPIVGARVLARHAVWSWLTVAMLASALVLGALHHPYWVRGGDGDVYIGLARSIATGQGYRFNGQPISLVPPLWPLVLAGAMKLTASFAILKLLTITLLMIGQWTSYFVLLRLTHARRAGLIVMATSLLPNFHELGFWFFAEPMFFALLAVALLLGVQISEGHQSLWRIIVFALLCGSLVAVRWAGLVIWPVLGATLLSGQLRPRLDRRWLALVLSAAVAAFTFFALRMWLRVSPDEIDIRFDSTLSVAYAAVNPTTWEHYLRRVTDAGRWMTGLFWPLLLARSSLRAVADTVGWSAVILVLIAAWQGGRTRHWLYAGVLLYCGMLAINWTSPVPRYLMPLAPLLLAAMLDGVDRLKEIFVPRVRKRIAAVVPAGILISIALGAAPLWIIELRIARSSNFESQVFGGTDRGLVLAAEYLREAGVRDADVVVSRAFTNFGRTSFTNGWMRALNVLLGGPAIHYMPTSVSRPPDKDVMKWIRSKKAKYYVYLPPQQISMTHFRPELPRKRRLEQDWQLYDVTGIKPRRIPLPDEVDWPTRVPGL